MISFLLAAVLAMQEPVPPTRSLGSGEAQMQSYRPEHTGLPIVQEVDLLEKASFAKAERAAATVRVYDHGGNEVNQLLSAAFKLRVNGTIRVPTLKSSERGEYSAAPLVLLVLPPNQREVHSIGLKQVRQYFTEFRKDLKWKVALLDSDGGTTDYTQDRAELLRRLDALGRKKETFVSSQDDSWLTSAIYAVSQMRLYEGPRIVLAFNPLLYEEFDEGRRGLARYGPEWLISVAKSVGAHIYIANVGGAGLLLPSGDASTASGQIETQREVLQTIVDRGSRMRITATDTHGGFANSFSEVGGQIEQDVKASYVLEFPLSDADRDKGLPQVEVQVEGSQYRVVVVDLSPLGDSAERRLLSQEKLMAIWQATTKPVTSTDFRIAQHVDYFPTRNGQRAVLPMSAQVAWSGKTPAPNTIHIAEYVEDMVLHTPVLEKEVDAEQIDQVVEWERDGRLTPGQYDWRIAVHDDNGNVLASADKRISVGLPESSQLQTSTLLVGSVCRAEPSGGGLRRRIASSAKEQEQPVSFADPLRTNDCRLKPSATGVFSKGEIARLLVRIYPIGKMEMEPPERWSALFSTRTAAGAASVSLPGSFVADSGGGYSAEVQLRLNEVGSQSLVVELRGPGLKKALVKTRQVVVQ